MKRSPLSVLISLIVTAVLGGVAFYAMIPALNIHSLDLYFFVVILAVLFLVVWSLLTGQKRERVFQADANGVYHIVTDHKTGKKPLPVLLSLGVVALMIVTVAVGQLVSATIFHAKSYYELLDVQTGDFTEDVAQISYDRIPMLDEASAVQLGKRALGAISTNTSLVSQFEVSYDYSQINYQNQPVRVSCLEYGDLIKWFNNTSDGLPGYIIVNMCTQEAKLVQLEDGMKYAASEHFNRNIYRHLRFHFPTYLFGDVNFEIDDNGDPWWVASRETCTIGLFGGRDVIGAVLVNAVTGECFDYTMEEVPTWVDRVCDANLIVEQYNYHGTLVNGWINSWLGQKAVTTTTGDYDGYNYLALNDDVYLYTGVTSAGGDESIVGFILVNQRTKEARYYNITGAEEYSAMSSARGAVQHLNYNATFPILLNISNQPTYFMALKDSAELVKMYAMVSVSDYQITATGATVAECQHAYEKLLEENGITVTVVEPDDVVTETTKTEVSGTILDLRWAVIDGNSYCYLQLTEGGSYYVIGAKQCPEAVILNVGDSVTVEHEAEAGGKIVNAVLK